MLLEKLCNTDGVSGNEQSVRDLIKKEITPYADNILIDSIGNLLAFKSGKNHSKTVMLSAHMDEVGFIVTKITDDGYIEFKSVGGIDTRVIISKKVRIGKDKIKGVIGIKAIHLTTSAERKKVPKEEDLYIDIGAKDKEDACKYVKLGDYISFDTEYELFGNSVKAKAIDDRVGCYILIESIKKDVYYDTWFCFTVQEEVGLRGSKVAAARITPDIALVIEGTTASDVSGVEPHMTVAKLNEGSAITFMDRTTIVNEKYYKWLFNIAKKNNIPVQYKTMASGGNDAGAIHLSNCGIITASISVPCRYIHSPTSLASLSDIDSTLKLCGEYLDNIKEIFEILKTNDYNQWEI